MAQATLAPEHMTDEQLWKLVRSRLLSAHLALMDGEARFTIAARLSIITQAVDELERRGAQGSLALVSDDWGARAASGVHQTG